MAKITETWQCDQCQLMFNISPETVQDFDDDQPCPVCSRGTIFYLFTTKTTITKKPGANMKMRVLYIIGFIAVLALVAVLFC